MRRFLYFVGWLQQCEVRVGLRAAVFCAGGVAFGGRDEVQRHVTRMRLGIRVAGHAVATIVVDGGAST